LRLADAPPLTALLAMFIRIGPILAARLLADFLPIGRAPAAHPLAVACLAPFSSVRFALDLRLACDDGHRAASGFDTGRNTPTSDEKVKTVLSGRRASQEEGQFDP
jgi:hypothetical protein